MHRVKVSDPVVWVEWSETHRVADEAWWVSLHSTHPTRIRFRTASPGACIRRGPCPLRSPRRRRYAEVMTQSIDTAAWDVMLVCRNGHVITDRLRSNPESDVVHCDRCGGATTLDRCPTCGHALPGRLPVPGLLPVGRPRPPAYCSLCGARLSRGPAAPRPPAPPVSALETMLHGCRAWSTNCSRLPRRDAPLPGRRPVRPGRRPPRRALLPLQFDAVRPRRPHADLRGGDAHRLPADVPRRRDATLALDRAKWTTTSSH